MRCKFLLNLGYVSAVARFDRAKDVDPRQGRTCNGPVMYDLRHIRPRLCQNARKMR